VASEQLKRPLGPLMTHHRESSLQGECDEGKAVREQVRSRDGDECERERDDSAPAEHVGEAFLLHHSFRPERRAEFLLTPHPLGSGPASRKMFAEFHR
jgi:hypothetical protein